MSDAPYCVMHSGNVRVPGLYRWFNLDEGDDFEWMFDSGYADLRLAGHFGRVKRVVIEANHFEPTIIFYVHPRKVNGELAVRCFDRVFDAPIDEMPEWIREEFANLKTYAKALESALDDLVEIFIDRTPQ